MNTFQLERVLRSDPYTKRAGYLGVFPLDGLRNIPLQYPSCFVFNTQPSTKEGEHWIAVFRQNEDIGYYFDSYGIHPYFRSGLSELLRTCKNWKFSKKTLQSLNTTTCGQYACFFLLHIARGYTIEGITYLLNGKSTADNDAFVFTFIRERFKSLKSIQQLQPVVL